MCRISLRCDRASAVGAELAGDHRQDRVAHAPNAWAISDEQIARVGSPVPKASSRRRQRTGTGGVGSR